MKLKPIKYYFAGILIIALLIGSFMLGKSSNNTVPVNNQLAPSLTPAQFSENFDALVKQNAPTDDLQEYIGNYQRDSSGNFVLKNSEN